MFVPPYVMVMTGEPPKPAPPIGYVGAVGPLQPSHESGRDISATIKRESHCNLPIRLPMSCVRVFVIDVPWIASRPPECLSLV